MSRRRVLVLLTICLAAAALAAGVLASLRPERVGAWAAARAEAALDRDVSIERARVRLFPVPAVSLERVALGGPRGADGAGSAAGPMAVAERVDLRPRLRPLLQRRVVVDALVLHRPQVLVEIDAAGASNLPRLEAGDPAEEPRFELQVRRIALREGRLVYRDARDGTVVRLSGVEQRLTLVEGGWSSAERSRFDGTLRVRDADVRMPERLARPLVDLRVRLAHRVEIDRAADRLHVEQAELRVQDLVIDGAGVVEDWSDAGRRSVALRLETGDFDVARLMGSLPEVLRTWPGPAAGGRELSSARGRGRLSARIDGRLGDGALPDLQGSLRLDGVSLAYGRAGRLLTGVAGDVEFTQRSVSTRGLDGRLLGEPLHLAFHVQDPAAPVGRLALRTVLDLREAHRLGLVPEPWQGRGRVMVDASAEGPVLHPEHVRLGGRLGLAGVALASDAWRQPLLVREATVELRGQELSGRGVRASLGSSAIQADLTLRDWIPHLLGRSARAPHLAFDAVAGDFDMDAAFGHEPGRYGYGELFFARLRDVPVDGRTAAAAAAEVGLGLPSIADLRVEGRVRARRVVKGGVAFEDIDLSLAGDGGDLVVRDARFRLSQPGVRLAGRLGGAADVPAAGGLPLSVEYEIEDDGAETFFGRFSALRGHLSGSVRLAGTAHMQLDAHLLPVRETLAGEGTFALEHGRLVNWPVARALGRQLGLAQFDVLDLHSGAGLYRLAGPRVELREWRLDAGDLGVTLAGAFDLDGRLDLGAAIELPRNLALLARGTHAATLVQAASTAEGRLPIGVRIGGTAADPTVRLDLGTLQQRVAASARQRAQEEAVELARRAAARVPPGRTQGAPAEQAPEPATVADPEDPDPVAAEPPAERP
jgi:hypothetical protein